MCELVGLKVVGLSASALGGVTLGNLPVGQWPTWGPHDGFEPAAGSIRPRVSNLLASLPVLLVPACTRLRRVLLAALRGDVCGEPEYRLVSCSDVRWPVCAVLLNELNLIDRLHVSTLGATCRDGGAGPGHVARHHSPTCPTCSVRTWWTFDHESETVRLGSPRYLPIIEAHAPSSARAWLQPRGGRPLAAAATEEMMAVVDQADILACQYSREDILDPQAGCTLNYLMDSGAPAWAGFRDCRISNYALDDGFDGTAVATHQHGAGSWSCPTAGSAWPVPRARRQGQGATGAQPAIERVPASYGCQRIAPGRNHLGRHHQPVHDLRAVMPFARPTFHPRDGPAKAKHRARLRASSILNRSSKTHVGNLMLEFGGGGHAALRNSPGGQREGRRCPQDAGRTHQRRR